eukprot:jgi/Undpi1/14265/HiC_scaffold_9.g03914.m1
MKLVCVFVCACAMAANFAEAFVPFAGRTTLSSSASRQASMLRQVESRQNTFTHASFASPVPSRSASGRSPSVTTTMGLFGLGAPEIAVCLAVAALILGPDKLAGVAKDVGKMAGELKDVPKEFQAGIEEGEAKAAKTVSEIESKSAPVMDAEPAAEEKKEEEKEKA